MAKYKVNSFDLEIRNNDEGVKNVFLSAELVNSNGNPKSIKYRLWTDTRFTDLGLIYTTLEMALSEARNYSAGIEIQEYQERAYLFVNDNQFSALAD